MELLALIMALNSLKEPCQAIITSDSKYLLGAFTEGWIEKWKSNGWRTSKKEAVLNQDLWQMLDRLLQIHHPSFEWVKGHAHSADNNRCDQLAVLASKSNNLLIDDGYEAVNPYKQSNANKAVDSTAPRVPTPADPSLRSGQESGHGEP
jgi:ribonuclease HI